MRPPEHPLRPGDLLEPFRTALIPPSLTRLRPDQTQVLDIAASTARIHTDLPPVPVWGYGADGRVTSPGPWLEAPAGTPVAVRFRNRLPGSVHPGDPLHPVPQLPFTVSVVDDPDGDTDSRQNQLGAQGGTTVPSGTPIGWTSTHLHGGHTRADSDGWPDNMAQAGGEQLSAYDNSLDNLDLGLDKVGPFLWYHDHAMNGTRHHVYAGLAGGYLIRDPREHLLGLPTEAGEGEIPLLLADRNVDAEAGHLRLLHKTTGDTAEFFGPLTLVNGLLWPRLAVRPEVYRLRLLNGSNARAYRLHLVEVRDRYEGGPDDGDHRYGGQGDDGHGDGGHGDGGHGDGDGHDGGRAGMAQPVQVTARPDLLQVIGTDGGLLWRAVPTGPDAALTLAPAERIDVLVNLSGLPEGSRLYLINSAQAPFGGDPPPDLDALWRDGDRPGRNPYPWVLRLDLDREAAVGGQPAALFEEITSAELNPGFRRLVHDPVGSAPGSPPELEIGEDHAHRVIALGETDPAGHLFLQELVEDPAGTVELQLIASATGPTRFRVANWMPDDPAPSDTRVSFYDRTVIRPQLGRWEVWRFVNTTGDTHPLHIHQSLFQPLGEQGVRLAFDMPDPADPTSTVNRYDPLTRRTAQPLLPDPGTPPRSYEPQEVLGWKDVIRVDPGHVVSVAIRFDLPGRYVYHCHVLEHEDTEMMRPLVVTVLPMEDGADGMHM